MNPSYQYVSPIQVEENVREKEPVTQNFLKI
jgi:hypothetical protein